MKPLETGFIRAACEGATVDGRQITGQQLEQIGANYNQEIYAARIWKEHARSFGSEGHFKPIGDVVAVKAETIRSGPLAGKVALYVKLAPLPELITLVRSGEKLHLSIEMDTNFSDTNQAYLVGVGCTDSPASIGTEIMKFSSQPHKRGLFSAPIELAQENDTAPKSTFKFF